MLLALLSYSDENKTAGTNRDFCTPARARLMRTSEVAFERQTLSSFVPLDLQRPIERYPATIIVKTCDKVCFLLQS